MPPVGEALEYITQVLSQRGPQAVPYPEATKWNIREHLSELLKAFPTLSIRTSEFHGNDGRILNLMKTEGTIPIHYMGVKYNIPVVIWLTDKYPQSAPLMYVTPTPNMIIKQNHSFVDPSGMVHTPCITNWLYPRSNLLDTVTEMSIIFGSETPLYSKPANYTGPAPMYQAAQPTSSYPMVNPMHPMQTSPPGAAGSSYYGTTVSPPPPPTQPPGMWNGPYGSQPPSSSQQQPPPPPPPTSQYPAMAAIGAPAAAAAGAAASAAATAAASASQKEQAKAQQEQQRLRAFRELAVYAAQLQLQMASDQLAEAASSEMERLLEVQRTLSEHDQKLQRVVQGIQEERQGCEGLVSQMGQRTQQLQGWLADNERKVAAAAGGQLDVDKVLVPADELTKQELQAQAEDLAAEDCLSVLEKGYAQGAMGTAEYLKQVRLVCKRQFFARARRLKIASMQQPLPSSGPLPPGATPMVATMRMGGPSPPPPAGMLTNPLAAR